MDKIRETEPEGALNAAALTPEVRTPPSLTETAPSPCRWPTMVITDSTMRDLDAALAADPLFHRCPDGQRGRVDVRYWYFHPLNLSCRHCAEGGGVCVVEPATVTCRHRIARRLAHVPEG